MGTYRVEVCRSVQAYYEVEVEAVDGVEASRLALARVSAGWRDMAPVCQSQMGDCDVAVSDIECVSEPDWEMQVPW